MKRNAGKGDSPRNLSEQFRVNYDLIDWTPKYQAGDPKAGRLIKSKQHNKNNDHKREN